MDFMHDCLEDARTYRLYVAIDDFNREGLCIETAILLLAQRLIRALDQLIE